MMQTKKSLRHTPTLAITFFIFIFWGLEATAAGKDENKLQAEKLYHQAIQLMEKKQDNDTLIKVIDILEKASKVDPENEDIWIQIAWRCWMVGDALPKESRDDRAMRIEYFEKGQAAGEKAMSLNKKSVGGIYWYTVNMASAGEMRGVLSSLWMAGTIFGNMGRVDRRDPYYLYGATRRFNSELFLRIPTWLSERFGFTTEYIEEDLLDNIERWPDYFDNYTFLARVYWSIEKKKEALDMLEYVLSRSPECMPSERAENERQQEFAAEMWKEYTGREYPQR